MKKADSKGKKGKGKRESKKDGADRSTSVKAQLVLRKATIGNDPIVSLPSETSRSYGDIPVVVQNKSTSDRTYTIRVGLFAISGSNVVLDEVNRPGIKAVTPASLNVAKGASGQFTIEMEPSASGTKGNYALVVLVLGGIPSVDIMRFFND